MRPEGAKRRREDPQVRRAQLLRAAERCFRTLGFQASTVDRIAAEAQVSVGLLYRFFDSKYSIIEAIILEDVEAQLEKMSIAIESASGNPQEILRAMVAQANFDPDRFALMFEITAEVCRNAALRSFVRAKRAEIHEVVVRKLMKKGIARKKAERMIERLEVISAFASSAALHALLYSDGSLERSMRMVSKLIGSAAAKTI